MHKIEQNYLSARHQRSLLVYCCWYVLTSGSCRASLRHSKARDTHLHLTLKANKTPYSEGYYITPPNFLMLFRWFITMVIVITKHRTWDIGYIRNEASRPHNFPERISHLYSLIINQNPVFNDYDLLML